MSLSKNDLLLRISLADLYLTEGRLEDAEKLTQEILEKAPDDPRGLTLVGRISFIKQDYPGAIGKFLEVLNKDPSSAIAHYFLGLCYMNAGQNKLAIRDLTKTVELDSKLYLAKVALGRAYIMEREGKLAEETLKEAVAQKRGRLASAPTPGPSTKDTGSL